MALMGFITFSRVSRVYTALKAPVSLYDGDVPLRRTEILGLLNRIPNAVPRELTENEPTTPMVVSTPI